ncbi:MAG: Ig-like domain-containing protein [Ruminococcus sp.]
MKKLLSIPLSMVIMLTMIVTALPAVSAETIGTETYSVTILNKTDAVISNNAVEVKKGDSYSTTISIKNKDEMGEIKVGVIMDDGTIIEPTVVDDYTLSVDIPKVTGNLYISAYTASKTSASQAGSSGYGEIIRVLENAKSDMPNVKYYGCEEIYLPNGSFYFEETFTPKEGYEIKEIKAVNTCAYLYDTVNYYGEPLAKGYDYREQDMLEGDSAGTLTKNEDGSYTLKYMPLGSMFVKVVAEPIGNPSETYSVTILNKTDAVISNNALEVKKGDSYSTTISIKNKDEMGEIKVGVIMDDGTIVAPTVVDDYTLSIDIPKVTGNLYISAYTASKTSAAQAGSSGYGEIIRVLENAKSDMPNVKYYGCEEIYLPNGSFYFEETFTPEEGYAITEISAVETCAHLYNIENYYGEISKGYSYTERGLFDDDYSGNLTKNEDGSYTLKYMPSGSIFVKVVAEKKPTVPEFVTSNITLKAGESRVINVVNGTVKSWSTSNKNVATVNNGKVTAVGKGTATITATLTTGEKLTCKVTVVNSPKLTSSSAILMSGATKTIKAVGGTVKAWTTSNKNVATVNNGKITALNKGTATVTATLTTGKKLSCKVIVKTSPKLSKTTVKVKKGGTATVKVIGKAATINNKYTNTKGAKITSKANATTLKIKGLKKGTTTLKIKVNGVKTLSLKVNVK